MKPSRAGFTTVEILIVVLILGIIAMMVVPKLGSASEEARDTALTADVITIRRQIQLYVTQHAGRLPHLDENGAADTANFVKRLTSRSDVTGKLNASGQMGPYLLEWPENPFAASAVAATIKFTATETPRDDSSGWHYNTKTGILSPNTKQGALDTDVPPGTTVMNMAIGE